MINRKLLLSVTVPFLLLIAACNRPPVNDTAPTTAPVELTPTEAVTATIAPTPTTVPATATQAPADAPPTATQAPTEVPATATPTPAPTAVQATPTPAPTAVPPTATSTPTAVPPTATSTPTAVPPTATPTPTAVPAEGNQEDITIPKFSMAGGFYDEEFMLTLSSAEGTKIYFTTDGSDPRTSRTARIYTQGITIYDNTNTPNVYSALTDISLNTYYPPDFNVDKGINVRAVVKLEDGTFGPVVTNSYFVGKTADYYSSLRVISLVTDADYLFDEDDGAYMIGARYYEWKNSSEYVQYDPGDVQNKTNYNFDGRESEFPVTIQVIENGAAVYTSDVGARISGNWSRSAFQKSIRLYARKEYGDGKLRYAFFDGMTDTEGELIEKFDKVTLWNGGNDNHILHFRDAFIQELAERAGTAVDVMHSEPYILFINGEFWGFYLLREKPEDYYIKSHYGIDDAQVTVIKNGGLESGTDEAYGDYWSLCDWVIKSDMTKEENYQKFCEQMDVNSFIDYMAIETYVCNSDWATGYLNNWMVWRSEVIDPSLEKADKMWRFILYDLDLSSGLYGSSETSYAYDSLSHIDVPWNDFNYAAMLNSLIKNKTFRNTFFNRYTSIIDNCFAIEKVEALLEEYTTAYKEATQATDYRFGRSWAANSYDDEAEGLLKFFRNRPKYAKQYLDVFCGRVPSSKTENKNQSAEYTKELLPSNWWYWGDAQYSVDAANEVFYVTVPTPLEDAWLAQAGESGLTLEEGCTYKVTFEGSCNGTGKFSLFVNRNDNGNYPTVSIDKYELTNELTKYESTFVMTMETHNDWNFCLNFGEGQGDFIIKNVTISKLD